MRSKARSSSPGLATRAERAFLKKVADAGGHDGLTAQAARDRLTSIEICEQIKKAQLHPILPPDKTAARAPDKAEQPLHPAVSAAVRAATSGYPYYFTAEEIRIGKGGRK